MSIAGLIEIQFVYNEIMKKYQLFKSKGEENRAFALCEVLEAIEEIFHQYHVTYDERADGTIHNIDFY